MSITPDGDYIAISSIYGDIFIIDLRRSKSILKQFQANSNLCSKREIYHINYLNGDQKKPFEIDIVDYLEGIFDEKVLIFFEYLYVLFGVRNWKL